MSFEERRRSALVVADCIARQGKAESEDLIKVVERLCTPRQLEVMQLLDSGVIMSDIARRLSIKPSRVRQLRTAVGRNIVRGKKMLNWKNIKRMEFE